MAIQFAATAAQDISNIRVILSSMAHMEKSPPERTGVKQSQLDSGLFTSLARAKREHAF